MNSTSVSDLGQYKGKNRLILVPSTEELVHQEKVFTNRESQFEDRDLKILVTEKNTDFFLVGKDGVIKAKKDSAFSADEVFDLIDSMPMRRHEMKEER